MEGPKNKGFLDVERMDGFIPVIHLISNNLHLSIKAAGASAYRLTCLEVKMADERFLAPDAHGARLIALNMVADELAKLLAKQQDEIKQMTNTIRKETAQDGP